MTTRYNVFFNCDEAFYKGVEKIETGLVDDYSKILPLFTYYDHDNLVKAKADMERAIEKSLKSIKKHSIKKKPKRDASKMRDPKYQQWYNSEEFNPMVPKAYLLMGKATFYKGEFLEAAGVFNYIIRHYKNFPEIHDARLWMARAYTEMNWLYEADNILNTITEDETFPVWKTGEFSQIKANILIQQKNYSDAVPYLKTAIAAESKRAQRRRLMFTLAQIYQEADNFENALATYEKVLKMSPSYDMNFNARIRMTEVFQGTTNSEGIQKSLKRMLKDEKNKEYLDQIYYALANIEMENGNEKQAIEYLELSIENSTQNKVQKSRSLIQLADLYYKNEEFRKAQPLYKQAASLLDPDSDEFSRINELSSVLNQLAGYLETIETQDSLLAVAEMPEGKRNELIKSLVDKAIYKAENPEIQTENDASGNVGMNLASPSEWYFYNSRIVESGKTEFKKTWGNRKLEDNWRRSVKDNIFTDTPDATLAEIPEAVEEKIPADQTSEFYLKQIPLSEEQQSLSKTKLGESYIGAATIYKNNLKSLDIAETNYTTLLNRIPDNTHVPDAKFGLYQIYLERGNNAEAEKMKQEIIRDYPNSKYAVMLNNPNYASELLLNKAKRDSLYTDTYEAYMEGDFARMIKNVKTAETKFPNSELEPNFMFMEALAIAKTQNPDVFKAKLKAIKEKHPKSEVVGYCDNLLELMNDGLLPSQGGKGGPMNIGVDTTSIAANNDVPEKTAATDPEQLYKLDLDAKHYYVIIHPEKDLDKNNLLFELSRFNFNRFLVKDFDISFIRLNRWYNILVINGFDGAEEALWYQKTIMDDGLLGDLINSPGVMQFIISDDNFRSMANMKNPDAYQLFYKKHYKPLENAVENPFDKGN